MIGLFALMAVGFANPLDEHLDKISDKYKGVPGLRLHLFKKPQILFTQASCSRGLFMFKTIPVALGVQKPMEQHFYADAEKITIWSPVQNQVIISSNQQVMMSRLANLPSLKRSMVNL